MPSQEQIVEVLKTIEDPELFIDIWFLGLIYDIKITEARVDILMTFTSPMCPVGPELIEQVKTKIEALDDVELVDVKVTFNPAWTPNEEVRGLLGLE